MRDVTTIEGKVRSLRIRNIDPYTCECNLRYYDRDNNECFFVFLSNERVEAKSGDFFLYKEVSEKGVIEHSFFHNHTIGIKHTCIKENLFFRKVAIMFLTIAILTGSFKFYRMVTYDSRLVAFINADLRAKGINPRSGNYNKRLYECKFANEDNLDPFYSREARDAANTACENRWR